MGRYRLLRRLRKFTLKASAEGDTMFNDTAYLFLIEIRCLNPLAYEQLLDEMLGGGW